MSGFFGELANNWAHASVMERTAFVVGLTGLSVFSGIAGSLLSLFQSRSYRRRAERLAQDNERLETERDAAIEKTDAVRAELRAWQPGAWLARARKEREQGNEERAIAAIEEGFERTRADIAGCATALAGHYLSLIVGPDSAASLAAGTRYARIASDLDPADPDAAFLMEEAQLLSGMAVDEVTDTLPGSFLPSDPTAADALITAILARGAQLFAAGHYRIVVRLYRRSELIARRAGFMQLEPGMAVQHKLAEALTLAGQYAEAMTKVQAMLPARHRFSGAEHPNTLNTRYLEALILDILGDHAAALAKVQALLPLQERVSGAKHPDTLNARWLEALILDNLGDHAAALAKLQALLPLQERVSGAEHHDTLTTRYLEASFLDRLGDHAAARAKIQALLPLRERVSGAEHPETLTARYLEADILDRLGDHFAALAKMQALLPLQERVSGVEHPHTLITRRLLARILIGIGRLDEAREQLDAIIPRQSAAEQRWSQLIEAELLAAEGNTAAAIALFDRLIPEIETTYLPTHYRLVEAKALRARLT